MFRRFLETLYASEGLRARVLLSGEAMADDLAAVIGRSRGRDPDDVELRAFVAMLLAAMGLRHRAMVEGVLAGRPAAEIEARVREAASTGVRRRRARLPGARRRPRAPQAPCSSTTRAISRRPSAPTRGRPWARRSVSQSRSRTRRYASTRPLLRPLRVVHEHVGHEAERALRLPAHQPVGHGDGAVGGDEQGGLVGAEGADRHGAHAAGQLVAGVEELDRLAAVNSWAPSRFTRMRVPKASANRPACR